MDIEEATPITDLHEILLTEGVAKERTRYLHEIDNLILRLEWHKKRSSDQPMQEYAIQILNFLRKNVDKNV